MTYCVAVLLALTLSPQQNPGSDGLVLVINKASGLTELSSQEVADLYLGQRSEIKGVRLRPVDRSDAKRLRKTFMKKTLGMSSSNYAKHWMAKRYRDGDSAPRKLADAEEVTDFVRAVPGAIGFISAAEAEQMDMKGIVIVARF